MNIINEKDLQSLREKLSQVRRNEESLVPNFLRKTYEFLEKDEYKDIVCWSDDGKAVIIKNPIQFSEKILPLYFKHNNIASYIRQLNMYNFKKRKTHQYEYTFIHDKFRKGQKELLSQIKRKGSDFITFLTKPRPQFEEPTTIDNMSLMQENYTLKQVQRTMSEKIQTLEKKLGDMSKINELLLIQIQILTTSGNSSYSGPSTDNLISEISRKITQNTSTFSTSSNHYPMEDSYPRYMRNNEHSNPNSVLGSRLWQSSHNSGLPSGMISPKRVKIENNTSSLIPEKKETKSKIDYFENLLNLVSKINSDEK